MPVRKDHWTQDDILALVGRTFKDKRGMRTVTRVEGKNIYWARPGEQERPQPKWWAYFREWLSTADEVGLPPTLEQAFSAWNQKREGVGQLLLYADPKGFHVRCLLSGELLGSVENLDDLSALIVKSLQR